MITYIYKGAHKVCVCMWGADSIEIGYDVCRGFFFSSG